jgi:ribosome-binding factor A
MSNRNEKIGEILRDLGARFLMLYGNTSSLLTVTRVEMSKDGKYATIFFTVLPASQTGKPTDLEKTALEFAKRKRSEFKQFVKENSKLGRIPLLDFEIDLGEKNRQRIDSLLNQ